MAALNGFVHNLSMATCEWFLMFLMFIDAALGFILTKFAHHCELQKPCLFCMRLDHVFSNENPGSYLSLFCDQHRADISCLISCDLHEKLVDVRQLCDDCFMSIMNRNQCNHGSNKGKMGIKGYQKPFLNRNLVHGPSSSGTCSCCKRHWKGNPSSRRLIQPGPAPLGGPTVTTKPPLPRIAGHSRYRRRNVFKRDRDRASGTSTPCHVEDSLSVDSDLDLDALSDFGCADFRLNSDSDSEFSFYEEEITSKPDVLGEKVDDPCVRKADSVDGSCVRKADSVHGSCVRKADSVDGSSVRKADSFDGSSVRKADSVHGSFVRKADSVDGSFVRKADSVDGSFVIKADSVDGSCVRKADSVDGSCLRKADSVHDSCVRKGDSGDGSSVRKADSVDDSCLKKGDSGNRAKSSSLASNVSIEENQSRAPSVQSRKQASNTTHADDVKENGSIHNKSLKSDKFLDHESEKSDGYESPVASSVNELRGEGVVERLKRQVESDQERLHLLHMELEEERNAAAIAADEAMAMITRLQEEKASLHMEALQYLRMMDEQAEYDMEALEKANDLITEKDKDIQDLEAELEYFRSRYEDELRGSTSTMAESNQNHTRNGNSKAPVLALEDEKKYILQSLSELEKKFSMANGDERAKTEDENGTQSRHTLNGSRKMVDGGEIDVGTLEGEISDLNERLKALEADRSFLEHACNTLQSNGGLEFIQEIAHHLHDLRTSRFDR